MEMMTQTRASLLNSLILARDNDLKTGKQLHMLVGFNDSAANASAGTLCCSAVRYNTPVDTR